jgi:hypothetical protein
MRTGIRGLTISSMDLTYFAMSSCVPAANGVQTGLCITNSDETMT